MKKISRYLSAILCLSLVLSVAAAASDFSSFSDARDHWASESLSRACEDSLLTGYDDGLLHPDDSITYPQVMAVLCRVLDLPDDDPLPSFLTGSEWYAPYAASISALGIDYDPELLSLDCVTRGEAFTLMARVFSLVDPDPDYSVLDSFSDSWLLTGTQRDAFASLVAGGYIQGSGGCLNSGGAVTRAEFVTALYRVFSSISRDGSFSAEGGVITGSADIKNVSFTSPVWISPLGGGVSLSGVSSGPVTITGDFSSISVTGSSSIERLTISCGVSASVFPGSGSSIGALVILGDGSEISVGEGISEILVLGDNVSLTLTSPVDTLDIRGSGCAVYCGPSSGVGTVKFSETSSRGLLTADCHVTEALLYGEENSVTANKSVDSLTISGTGNSVSGSGSIESLIIRSSDAECSIKASKQIDAIFQSPVKASAELSVPVFLPAGEELVSSAVISSDGAVSCSAIWSVDGKEVSSESLDLDGTPVSITMTCLPELDEDSPLFIHVSLSLRYGDGESEEYGSDVRMENYPAEYYDEANRALEIVTTGYAGDYTLQWAEEHDYSDAVKTAWVNDKGYSSTTKYLIWVNITYQRVNIFEGSAGNWTLVRSCLCSTGSSGNDTPVGVYTIFGRSSSGWKTSTYWCKPVVNFKTGSGLAFHSRLYDTTFSYLVEPDIGYPCSHGCVRMYDEDIQWIYDNVPNGTTVVVY